MEIFSLSQDEVAATIRVLLIALGLLAGLWILARLLFRRDDFARTLFVIGGLLVAMAALSLYLDTRPTIPGRVIGKREQIKQRSIGQNWSFGYLAEIEYAPPGSDKRRSQEVRTGERIYDQLIVGDSVELHYWQVGGVIELVRPAERTTLDVLMQSTDVQILLLVALAAGFCVLVGVVRKDAMAALVAVAICCFLFLVLVEVLRGVRAMPVQGPQSVATVQRVTRIHKRGLGSSSTSAGRSMSLWQPIDVWLLQFRPEGAADSVIGFDMTDAFEHELQAGDSVEIVYDRDRPRHAQLVDAARTHWWKNALFPKGPGLLVLGLVAWYFARHARRRREHSPAGAVDNIP